MANAASARSTPRSTWRSASRTSSAAALAAAARRILSRPGCVPRVLGKLHRQRPGVDGDQAPAAGARRCDTGTRWIQSVRPLSEIGGGPVSAVASQVAGLAGRLRTAGNPGAQVGGRLIEAGKRLENRGGRRVAQHAIFARQQQRRAAACAGEQEERTAKRRHRFQPQRFRRRKPCMKRPSKALGPGLARQPDLRRDGGDLVAMIDRLDQRRVIGQRRRGAGGQGQGLGRTGGQE